MSAAPAVRGPGFVIRSATRDDVSDLHQLIRGLADYEHLAEICISTELDLTEALFGHFPVAESLIAHAELNSQVAAGFALFFHTYSTFLGRRSLWLEDIFVRPEFRARGLGRQFIVALAGIARTRGCGRFEWTVLDWNEPAIRFYESLGARVLPEWRIARVTGDALDTLAGR